MKNHMKKIVKLLNYYQIPGFRSQYTWKSTIAAIGYSLVVLFSFGAMIAYSFWYGVLWFMVLIGIIFLFFNYKGILDKISKIKLRYYFTATIVSLFIIGIVSAMAPPARNIAKNNLPKIEVESKPEVKGVETKTEQETKPTEEVKIETKEEKITEDIPFTTKETNDDSIKKGEQKVKQEGKIGKKEKVYKVIYENDKETKRELTSENIIKEPVEKIVLIGTYETKSESASIITEKPVVTDTGQNDKSNDSTSVTSQPEPSCDPNYSGACVPIASDVDCAGGSGNGPAYVKGPVKVIGTDIYDLDRDGNGIGCE